MIEMGRKKSVAELESLLAIAKESGKVTTSRKALADLKAAHSKKNW